MDPALSDAIHRTLPFGVLVWEATGDDPASLVLRSVNPAVERQTGADLVPMVGRPVFEVFPGPGAVDWAAATLEAAAAQRPAAVELPHPAPDGRTLWFRAHLSPLGGRLVAVAHEDVTARVEQERELAASERLNRSIVANLLEGIIVIDREGIVRQVNRAVSELCRADASVLIGRHIRELPLEAVLDPSGEPQRVRNIPASRALRGESVRDVLVQIARRDGTRAWVEVNSSPLIEAGADEPYGAVSTYVDVTDRVERDRRVRHEADHDPLTGLPNRRALDRAFAAMLARAQERGHGVAALMLDLDGFKRLNDRFGHAAGDEALREAARRLRGLVRERDLVARFGGDEFVVLTSHASGSQALARELRERVEASLHEPMALGDAEARLDATVGIADYPDDGSSAGELLALADRRMYERRRGA